MARKKLSKADCQAFLKRFYNSKLSVARFCENENISIPTFYKRRQRAGADLKNRKQSDSPVQFIPLRTESAPSVQLQEGFSLELQNGSVLKIPMKFDSESTASLICVLKEIGF